MKEPPLDQVYASLREFDDEKTVKDIQTDVGVHRPVSLGIKRKMFTSLPFARSNHIPIHTVYTCLWKEVSTKHSVQSPLTKGKPIILRLAIASILDLRFGAVRVLISIVKHRLKF